MEQEILSRLVWCGSLRFVNVTVMTQIRRRIRGGSLRYYAGLGWCVLAYSMNGMQIQIVACRGLRCAPKCHVH